MPPTTIQEMIESERPRTRGERALKWLYFLAPLLVTAAILAITCLASGLETARTLPQVLGIVLRNLPGQFAADLAWQTVRFQGLSSFLFWPWLVGVLASAAGSGRGPGAVDAAGDREMWQGVGGHSRAATASTASR